MAKRFTDTNKWADEWFQDLSPVNKCLWVYICDNCDNAGVWKVNKSLAEFQIKAKIDWQKVFVSFGNRCVFIKEDRVFITGFVKFQYGNLSEHCTPHKKIIALLQSHGIDFNNLSKSTQVGYLNIQGTLEDKDKDKDKDNKKEDKSLREGTEKYLDNVYLTKSEHEKLLSELGPVFLARCIEKLDSYIENNSKGKKYKNHYKAMKMWVINSVKEEGLKPAPYNAQEQALNTESKVRIDKAYQEAMEEVARRKRELAGEMPGPIDLRSLCNGIGKDVI